MASGKHAREERFAWLVAPLMLAAVGVAFAIVLGLSAGDFGPLLAVLFAIPILWVIVSALWPAHADRGCPKCGKDALERLDAHATHGVRCGECGFSDESRSSWLLAEEEGPLEDIVLEQRGRKKRRPPMDTSMRGD